jgi:hypothetical protein
MNFLTLLATRTAKVILEIGRRFAVESEVGICSVYENDENRVKSANLPSTARANTQRARRED